MFLKRSLLHQRQAFASALRSGARPFSSETAMQSMEPHEYRDLTANHDAVYKDLVKQSHEMPPSRLEGVEETIMQDTYTSGEKRSLFERIAEKEDGDHPHVNFIKNKI